MNLMVPCTDIPGSRTSDPAPHPFHAGFFEYIYEIVLNVPIHLLTVALEP